MIEYKDVLKKLKDAGYTTTRLRRERIISESTLTRIRNDQPLTTDTINTICLLLDCQPNYIMEFIPTEEELMHIYAKIGDDQAENPMSKKVN